MKIIEGEREFSEYSRDAGMLEIRPSKVYVGDGEVDVLSIIEEAKKLHLPITPRASGTSIPSQAVGSGILLLQSGRRVVVGPEMTVSCEPGVVKAELNVMVEQRGLWMPVDPSSYKSCSVGGMVANNASGARTFKYHATVDYVREVRVVLPEEGPRIFAPVGLEEALHSGGSTGKVAELIVDNQKAIALEMPRVTKNSSGYRLDKIVRGGTFDLQKLFAGSEGTLGVMVEVQLALLKRPLSRLLMIFETSLDDLDVVAADLRKHNPSAIELVDKTVFRLTGREKVVKPYSRSDQDYLVFCEFDGHSEEETRRVIDELSADQRLAQREPLVLTAPSEVTGAWEARNETLTIAGEIRKGTRVLLPGFEDLVVPPENLGRLLRFSRTTLEGRGLQFVMYGHAGDANLHVRPLLDPGSATERRLLGDLMEEFFEETWRMGGSISGEHGDGRLRAPYVSRQYRDTFEIMKRIKEIYDPSYLLNPGVKIV